MNERVSARLTLTSFDWFMLGNMLLWNAVILFGYRWRRLEFYLYLLLVLFQVVGMVAAWIPLRRVAIPGWVLAALQVALLLHLAGGSVFVGGTRLYDCYLVPWANLPAWASQFFRYDKLVHAYFAAMGAAGIRAVWPRLGLGSARHPMVPALIGLTVMGICGLVEITEYVATKVVHLPEVGGYDNNLQDLLANFLGLVAALLIMALHRPRGEAP
ncbi:MAG TPA: hypothetical protein VD902_04370 [Symbiobacteriaceae bacterium]|nr:hypothetical protein [Symbiobacteriaceae bacterium]